MSHFAVLVIGEGVEEKLHPYEELHLPLDEWETDPRAVFEVEIEDNPESISEYLTKNLSLWRDDVERADRTVSDLERKGSRVPGAILDAASSDTPEEVTEFAMSFREQFIDSLPDGTRITIVDCHI